jgi:hypothetical protein
MIDLRGGLISIESAVYIRLSLFWIELNICAAQDTVPRFPIPFHLIGSPYSATHESRGRKHLDQLIQVSGLFSLLSSAEMLDIFTELSFLVIALTAEGSLRIQWDADNFPGFGFYPTLHKLLSRQDDSGNPVQEMCRLGAILFLAEVRRKFGISPVVTNVQCSKLQELLHANEVLWVKQLDHIRVWTILMGGCAAETPSGHHWAVKALIRSKNCLKERSCAEFIDMASQVWWIDEVFLSKSQELQSEFMKMTID